MTDWHRVSKDIELKDGTKVKEYTLVLNTTDTNVVTYVEHIFQMVMDNQREGEK